MGANRLLNLRTIASNSRTLSLVVLAHFVLLGIHAAAHSMLAVVLSDFQSIIVVLAMIVGPIIAVVLLYTTHRRAGLSVNRTLEELDSQASLGQKRADVCFSVPPRIAI